MIFLDPLGIRLSHQYDGGHDGGHDGGLPLRLRTFSLTPEAVRWAQYMASPAQAGVDSKAQCQVYLESLAIAGFAQWVTRSPMRLTASYDRQQSTGICRVNGHRIAVIPVVGKPNAQILIPQVALRDRGVQLVVLVAIQTEQSPAGSRFTTDSGTVSVSLLTALNCQQIDPKQLRTIGDAYSVELTQFDQSPEQVLSYLKESNSGPSSGANRGSNRESGQSSAGWLRVKPGRNEATCRADCELQPSAEPKQELTALLNRFDLEGIMVPPETSGVYTDFSVAEYHLRLYALTWAVSTSAAPAELGLFLILGPIKGSYLPIGTRLTVKENHLLTTEPHFRWTAHPAYLYTQVFGLWEEQLTVEVLLPNTRPLTLPPFHFQQEHQLN